MKLRPPREGASLWEPGKLRQEGFQRPQVPAEPRGDRQGLGAGTEGSDLHVVWTLNKHHGLVRSEPHEPDLLRLCFQTFFGHHSESVFRPAHVVDLHRIGGHARFVPFESVSGHRRAHETCGEEEFRVSIDMLEEVLLGELADRSVTDHVSQGSREEAHQPGTQRF